MLMRQQERLEGRVHNIDEQLTKLESDKTLMKVQYDTHNAYTHRHTILNIIGTGPIVPCHHVVILCCNFVYTVL